MTIPHILLSRALVYKDPTFDSGTSKTVLSSVLNTPVSHPQL